MSLLYKLFETSGLKSLVLKPIIILEYIIIFSRFSLTGIDNSCNKPYKILCSWLLFLEVTNCLDKCFNEHLNLSNIISIICSWILKIIFTIFIRCIFQIILYIGRAVWCIWYSFIIIIFRSIILNYDCLLPDST